MQSKAATVAEYLAQLPPDRREAIQAVRQVILKNLDKDLAEGMQYGMIGYFVPHAVFPAGYHCDPKQPLPYAGLASQKQHLSLYMMSLYTGGAAASDHVRWFGSAWAKAVADGRATKLDMGKACIRFKTLADIPLDVIGEAIRRVPAKVYIDRYVASLAASGKAPKVTSGSAGVKKTLAASSRDRGGSAKNAAGKTTTKTSKRSTKKPAARKAAATRAAKARAVR